MQSTRNKLIQLLEDNKDTFISGQLLSEKLNVSRNSIWKHMKTLEKAGYHIEAKPKLGYRIINNSGQLNEYTLKWGLETSWLGNQIVYDDCVTSTQVIAHQLAQENAEHGTIVIAGEQTASKGRMGRKWHSAKGKGIWMSLILKPSILPYLAPQLTLVTATVIADVLYNHTGIKPQIKWPNDILINGKKVAGILTEMQAEQDQIQYVVIGIGLNVNQAKSDLPEDIQKRATSIRIETNNKWSLKDIIQKILLTFENSFNLYLNTGFPDIKNKWEGYGYKIGEPIGIKTAKKHWQAIFMGIAEDGALLVKNSQEEIEKLYSAEIEWFKGEF